MKTDFRHVSASSFNHAPLMRSHERRPSSMAYIKQRHDFAEPVCQCGTRHTRPGARSPLRAPPCSSCGFRDVSPHDRRNGYRTCRTCRNRANDMLAVRKLKRAAKTVPQTAEDVAAIAARVRAERPGAAP